MPVRCMNTIGTVGIMSGIPTLPTPFVKCLIDMIVFNNEYLLSKDEQILYSFAPMSYHSMARNNLSKYMRGQWLLMLDTDQTFEPDVLVRMKFIADENNLDVLTGLYFQKTEPYYPIIYKLNEDRFEHITKWDSDLIEIDSAGAGCLFIRHHVLFKLFSKGILPFAELPGLSEDHSFFTKLKEIGIRAYCATDVKIGHLHWGDITEEDYNAKDSRNGW